MPTWIDAAVPAPVEFLLIAVNNPACGLRALGPAFDASFVPYRHPGERLPSVPVQCRRLWPGVLRNSFRYGRAYEAGQCTELACLADPCGTVRIVPHGISSGGDGSTR